MKTLLWIHLLLILIGVVLGFFGQLEEATADSENWWELVIVPIGVALQVAVLFFFLVLLSRSSHISSFFWLYYLMAVFAAAVGIGLIAQAIYFKIWDPNYFVIFPSSLGALAGLRATYLFKLWRHRESF